MTGRTFGAVFAIFSLAISLACTRVVVFARFCIRKITKPNSPKSDQIKTESTISAGFVCAKSLIRHI